MTRQASHEGQGRALGLISRIAGTSSLLQPYMPGRRSASHAHAHNLALRNRATASPASRESDAATRELAALLERFAATAGLEDALRLVAMELPRALGLARVVVALNTPEAARLAADSQALGYAEAQQRPPVSPAHVTRPLWLLPRQPAAADDALEIPIKVGGERLGLLRAWMATDDARPPEALLAPLRITCSMLGQQVLLFRLRSSPAGLDVPDVVLTSDERRSWNALLGYVAHEVKTPLTCIQGHAQLLSRYVRAARAATKTKQGTLARLLDDCERHLPALEKQVARIEQLLRDTLDLAQNDDGVLALAPTRENLAALIREAAQRLEAELSRAITVEAPQAMWVLCDAARIGRVLGEILRYMARGGLERDIQIRMAEAEAGGMRVARVTIGYAYSPAALPLDSSIAGAIFGTDSAASPLDLQLALSAAILRQHGGSLRYLPAAVDGSELVLTLPILEVPPA